MTPEEEAEIKRRQKARNYVLGGTLLFFVILFYMITIARIGG
ncbi:hypothetical protein ACI5KX_11495 [Erythrobacter sp. GH1-10]